MSRQRGTANPPRKIRQPHGGALLSGGVPGHKGGTGRPPNWLRDWCDDMLADPTAKQQVLSILHDKDHPAFAQMWRTVSERAKGRPTQSIELSGPDGEPMEHAHVLVWRFGDREIPFK